MAIDLLAIEPHKVSRDLSGYVTYIFGAGKTGKTTLSVQLDKALLLAFEQGYRALSGVSAQPIKTWSEFLQVVRQLKKSEVKEKYHSIVIDTVDICAGLCEKYICDREGVTKLSEIPWGNGFKMVKDEFESQFRTITQNDYALFFISHAKDKVFKRPDGTEYNQIVPSLSSMYNEIVRNMADIQGYAHQVRVSDNETKVMLTLRSSDGTIECGSRFKYIVPRIEFTYEALSKALNDAIDKEAELNGQYVTEEKEKDTEATTYDYNSLMSEFQELASTLMQRDQSNGMKITSIIDKYLGKGKKISEATPEQAEMVYLIVDEIKDSLL